MEHTKTTSFFKALLTAGALFAVSGAANAEGVTNLSIATRVSTLGVGVELKYQFHEKFNGRFVVNEYDADYNETNSGNQYNGDFNLSTYGLIADWHPTGNGFRLSAGVYSNSNGLIARTDGNMFTFDGQQYIGNARATVDFKSLAPYAGLGWSSQKDNGWSFDFEIGALFQGDTELRASGNAGPCNFSVNASGVATVGGVGACTTSGVTQAEFTADIEAEHRELEDDLNDLKVYPVVSIGIQYRF